MAEHFIKALKWYFLCLTLIGGTTCMMISQETGSIRTVFPGVVLYGVAYVMAAFWKDFRGRLLFASLSVFLLIAFGAQFIPMILFILFGITDEFNPYIIWAIATGLFGVPMMTLVFRKLD